MEAVPLSVRPADDPHWLGFLKTQPDATVFHHPAWSRLLGETYGHRALALVQADEDGQIVAGLPLLEMRGMLSRRRFVSLPFTDHCPPLASTPDGLARLTLSLVRWQQETGARQLAIHGALPSVPGVHPVVRGVRHLLPLDRSSEQIFDSLKGGPVHRAIRKARREGVEARVSQSPESQESFYRLHLETRRRLGVPVQPRRFLTAVFSQVVGSGLGFTVFAYKEGRPIAAALFLAWNRNLIYKFGASDPRYWELRPNNLVMWTAIEWACQHGYRLLDFGRTDLDNRGLREFKSRWGSTEVPLIYSYTGPTPHGSMPRAPMRALAAVIRTSPPIVCRAMGELLYGRAPGSFA